jgi:spore germination protein GerM
MNAHTAPRPRGLAVARLLVALLLVPLTAACLGTGSAGPLPTPTLDGPSTAPLPSRPATSPSVESSPPTTPPSSPGSPAPTTEPTAPATDRPTDPPATDGTPETMQSVPYFLMRDPTGRLNPTLVPVRRTVERTVGVGRAALEQLLSGPRPGDYEADVGGISTAIPEGTVLLGLDITDGLATVDLSREFESGGGSYSMGARLAQVVYTLTRFPTVDRVAFRLDGVPVTVFSAEGLVLDGPVDRDDYLDYLPPIFVDSPAWGSVVIGPAVENDVPGRYLVEVRGRANVFEAQFYAALLDQDGNVLDEESVMASCGSGCWGEFEFILGQDAPGEATLQVWNLSARDGSVEDLRAYRLDFAPEDTGEGCGC